MIAIGIAHYAFIRQLPMWPVLPLVWAWIIDRMKLRLSVTVTKVLSSSGSKLRPFAHCVTG